MIIRPFTAEDWPALADHQYPGISQTSAEEMIAQWNTRLYDGRYFELLAVEHNGCVIGFVSLLAQPDGAVSEGVEIYPPYRRQGHAFRAVTLLLQHAQALGYDTVTAQIRKDNAASLALHRKLGFRIQTEFVNKRGNPVFALEKDLS